MWHLVNTLFHRFDLIKRSFLSQEETANRSVSKRMTFSLSLSHTYAHIHKRSRKRKKKKTERKKGASVKANNTKDRDKIQFANNILDGNTIKWSYKS